MKELIYSRKEKKLRALISDCNNHKATLLATKENYSPEYFNLKLSEYDSFIQAKQNEIKLLKKQRSTFVQIGILLLFISLFGFLLISKPAFVGFVAYDNDSYSNEELALRNITVGIENVDFVNEENILENLSIILNQSSQEINITENDSKITNESNSSDIDIDIDNEFSYVNEGEVLENITIRNISIENLTIENIYIENISIENITLENISLDNLSIENISIGNVTIENITLENVTIEQNITVDEFVNLPPTGAVPHQTMESNMILSIDLNEYFVDNETLNYTVYTHEFLGLELGDSVISISSSNITGNFTVFVYIEDGFNLLISRINVTVEEFGIMEEMMILDDGPVSYNSCNPINNNLIINQTLDCNHSTISLSDLTIQTGGNLNLTNVTLVVDNFVVEAGSSFSITNSHSTVWVNGNWTISGQVNITNSTIRLNGTGDGYNGIYVNPTGWLIINDSSNITNGDITDANYFLSVSPGSNFSMRNSYLSECGWNNSDPLDPSVGFAVGASNVIIENNHFERNAVGIILFMSNNSILDGNYFDINGTVIVPYMSANITINNTIINNSVIQGQGVNNVGVFMAATNNVTISNTYISNAGLGIMVAMSSNIISTNLTLKNNNISYSVSGNSNNITLINSILENSSINGLNIDDTITEMYIYNNIFNNTDNIVIENGGSPSFLNTSQSTATNIIGGNFIGGNYWTNASGDGYSNTCTDSVAPIGICDNYLNYTNGTSVAIDWLPLSDEFESACDYYCDSCATCNTEITNAGAGETVCMNQSVTSSGTCIDSNGKDNFSFDCQGNDMTMTGGFGWGIDLDDTGDDSNYNTVKNCNIYDYWSGIRVFGGLNNSMQDIVVSGSIYGVSLGTGSENTYINNITLFENTNGLSITRSTKSVVINSNFSNNTLNFQIIGSNDANFDNIISKNNIIDHKFKIYYNYSISNFEFNSINAGDAGTLICAKCENITVKDLNLSNYNQNGLLFFNTSNSSISNVTISDNTYGLYLDLSSDNIISNITIENNENCLKLDESSRNYISNIICNFGMDGLSIGDSSNNNFISNVSSVSFSSGFSISDSLNNYVEMSNFSNNTNLGLSISYSHNITLVNNNISNNFRNFYIAGNENKYYNHTILQNNFVDNKYRIYYNYSISDFEFNSTTAPNAGTFICSNCNNLTIKDMNLSHKNAHGILFFNSSNSYFDNIFISYNTYGVDLRYSSNNYFSNINIVDHEYEGFELSDESSNNILANISIYNNSNNGLTLTSGCENNTISNLTVSRIDYDAGITLSGSSNNIFNDIFSFNNSEGISMFSNSNIVGNNTIKNFRSENNNYGIQLSYGGKNNTFINPIINNSITADVRMYASGTRDINNSFINASFDYDNISFYDCDDVGDVCELYVKNYANVQVNYTNSTPVVGYTVYGYNATDIIKDSALTNSEGFITLNLTEVTIWSNEGGTTYGGFKNYHSNYTVNITDGTYVDSVSVNMSTNREIQLTLFSDDCNYYCDSCASCETNFSNALFGETVCVTQNISSNGTCLNIANTNNVILDCQDNYALGNGTGTGISLAWSSSDNNTFKNCHIKDFITGVEFSGVANNDIIDSTIENIGQYGININFGTDVTLSNVNLTNVSNRGINTEWGDNHYFEYLNLNQCGLIGISMESGGNFTLRNITINVESESTNMGLKISPESGKPNDIDESVKVNNKPVKYYDGTFKVCPDNQILEFNNTISMLQFYKCNNVTVNNTEVIDGITVFGTNNTKFFNINSSNNYYGIYESGGYNHTISNITVINSYIGINANNFVNVSNALIINSNWGININTNIYVKDSYISDSDRCLKISAFDMSYSKICAENITINNCNYGVETSDCALANIKINNSNRGINILNARNNSYTNITIINSNTSIHASDEIEILKIINSNITNAYVNDIYIDSSISSDNINLTLINTTFRLYNVSFEQCESVSDLCEIHVKWYANVQVNYSNGSAVVGETVYGYNESDDLKNFKSTNSNGYVILNLTEVTIWDNRFD